jgi:hypothetical protein
VLSDGSGRGGKNARARCRRSCWREAAAALVGRAAAAAVGAAAGLMGGSCRAAPASPVVRHGNFVSNVLWLCFLMGDALRACAGA